MLSASKLTTKREDSGKLQRQQDNSRKELWSAREQQNGSGQQMQTIYKCVAVIATSVKNIVN